jgi:hypothetical protein
VAPNFLEKLCIPDENDDVADDDDSFLVKYYVMELFTRNSLPQAFYGQNH